MAEGYSDGSIIVNTDLDTQGFEAGSQRMKNAVDSATTSFEQMGEHLKNAVNKGVQATQSAAPLIDNAVQQSVGAFQAGANRAQSFIDQWAQAMPQKQFDSGLKSLGKMIDSVSGKIENLSQSYAKAADGGEKAISQFEGKATTVESSLDAVCAKIDEMYQSAVRTDGGLVKGKENENLLQLITRYDELTERLVEMQTQIGKVKVDTERAKAAELAATQKVKAELDAAKRSARELADTNKQAWNTVKDEIKSASAETKAFDSSYTALGKSISSLENKMYALEPAAKKAMSGNESAVDSFEFKVANTQRTIQTLRGQLDALGSTTVTTTAYDEVNAKIEQARSTLNGYVTEQQKLLNKGVSQDSTEWTTIAQKIAQAKAEIQKYEAEKQNLETTGNATISGADTAGYQELLQKIAELEQKLAEYESKVATANGKMRIFTTLLKGIGKVGITPFKLLGKSIDSVTNKLKTLNKNGNSTTAMVKKFTKAFTSIGTRIKSMLKRRFISGIIKGATEGIKNIVQVSPEVNKAMSSMTTALSQLKNSFGTAFAPIIVTVAPILTYLINLLSEGLTKIGMFFAALTGATRFKKAVAVQQDYAESLKDISKNSDKANKSTDKANKSLAAFDQLNVLNTNTSGETDDTEKKDDELAQMFQDVPIDSGIAGFVEKIKAEINNGHFESLGGLLTEKINNLLQSVNNAVDWDNVGFKITAFVDGLTRTLNSLVDNVNWTLIGNTIASGVNTVVNTLYLLVTGFDWANLGRSLMTGLNSFSRNLDWNKLGRTLGAGLQAALSFIHAIVHNFDYRTLARGLGSGLMGAVNSIDWAMLGDTISTFVRNAFDFVRTLADSIDFEQIGADVATALNNIDWPGIFSSLAGMLSSLLGGALLLLIGFAETLDWSKLGTDIWNSLSGVFDSVNWSSLLTKLAVLLGSLIGGALQFITDLLKEAGMNIAGGLFYGILNGFGDIFDWIKTNVFEPFVNAFCNAFGIHSPSTIMAELGNYLILGLKKGVVSAWNDIKTLFSKAWKNISDACISACTDLKTVMSGTLSDVKKTVSNKLNSLKSILSNSFSKAHSIISGKVNSIKSNISKGFDSMKSIVSSRMNEIGSSIRTKFTNLASDAWSWGSDICDNIASGIDACSSWIQDSVSSVAQTIRDFLGFSEPDKGPLSDFHTYMPDMIKLMAEGIYKNKSTAINAVSELANQISDEAQNAKVLLPISAETEYTRFLNSFSDTVTDSFMDLISQLEAIAGSVTFSAPAVAMGTVLPYKFEQNEYEDSNNGGESMIVSAIEQALENVMDRRGFAQGSDGDIVVQIDSREVFRAVRKEAEHHKRMYGRPALG